MTDHDDPGSHDIAATDQPGGSDTWAPGQHPLSPATGPSADDTPPQPWPAPRMPPPPSADAPPPVPVAAQPAEASPPQPWPQRSAHHRIPEPGGHPGGQHHITPSPAQGVAAPTPAPRRVNYIRTDDLQRLPRRPPSRGWRRLLYRLTGGHINPGQSAQDKRRAELQRRARTLLRGNYRIGVLGKGGVGKTTIAACLGSTLAQLRQEDRVVAIDADTAFGKLGSRVDPDAVDSYWELVTDQHLHTFPDVRSRVGANTAGLFVLPGDRCPLDPGLYHEALARLDPHFAITIIDCGATMATEVTRAVVADLDAAIVVTTPWADGASTAHQSLRWLAEHATPGLLRRTAVILNDSDGNADHKTRSAVAESFVGRGLPVFQIPFDRRLRPGGVIDINRGITTQTRQRFLEIAATLASNFGDNTHRHRHPLPPPGSGGPVTGSR